MKVAITGAAGLFGHGLVAAFSTRHQVFPLTRAEADITNAEAVRAALERIRPDLVVHPAAIPDLDLCDADPAKALRVNYQGTCNVADAARRLGAGLVHISTDAVFDGRKVTPYVETDPTAPITVYGRTKLQAEQAVKTLERYWIFRVPVLFGPGKTNFVEKGLRKLAAGEEYKVASDQLGCTAHTVDAGLKIMEVAESGPLRPLSPGQSGSVYAMGVGPRGGETGRARSRQGHRRSGRLDAAACSSAEILGDGNESLA